MPTVQAFMDSPAFIRGLMGPFGSGKSTACIWELIQKGLQQTPGPDGVRRTRWCVVRQSYRQLEDSTIKSFLQWFPPYIYGTWRSSDHSYLMKSLSAGAGEPAAEMEFSFRALDRPDQVGNLLSTEYTGAWVNEGRDPPWAIINTLSGRVGRYPAKKDGGTTWNGIILDTNPPDSDSEWYKFFEEKDHSEAVAALNKVYRAMGLAELTVDTYRQCFKQPSGRAPNAENLGNLPAGYYERLAIGKSDDWIKVYVDGLYGFTMDGKAVFPEYLDTLHCPDDPAKLPKLNPEFTVTRSWDFGLTPACIFGQLFPDGRWIVTDEMVSEDMGFDQFSDHVLDYSRRYMRGVVFEDVGDPAGRQRAQTDTKTCFEIAHAKEIFMQSAPQTLQIRLEGTRKPMRMLVNGRPAFQIHPRCRVTRKGLMGGYHYRRVQVTGERYEDLPNKNRFSHPCDALTYQGAWHFGDSLRIIPDRGGIDRRAALEDRTRSRTTGY